MVGQMKRWVVSRRDSAEMTEGIEGSLNISLGLGKSAQASCAEPAEGVVFVDIEGLEFVQTGGRYFPFLGSQKALALFPSAYVDEGAIRFILNGADVMRPGIRRFDEWGEAGRLVVVREEKKERGIAVSTSQVTSGEAGPMKKGSCLKNIHYVGDRFWALHKTL
jgi:malignant T-cell-amplified sequence